ncbi:hypothetical protein [Slackia heliotrinireducens]|uniref:hypothetical protein n=1 Tax=Slackia heliotrinireducens TaxID=84110 RepID=UPI001E50AD4A|nr:hypothetical protein [Slackia heliotrinireducens]
MNRSSQLAAEPNTFVDNLVLYRGLWLPVEVKLNIYTTSNLEDQLEQYMHVDKIEHEGMTFGQDMLWLDRVLVVDTEGLYLYTGGTMHYLLLWDDFKSEQDMLDALDARLDAICAW